MLDYILANPMVGLFIMPRFCQLELIDVSHLSANRAQLLGRSRALV